MIGEANLWGLYLPWILLLSLGALPVTWGLHRLLARTGFYRWVWHPALFDMALYLLALYALSRATSILQ
jgi:protein-S-isoprenylcysteine O-methyltransferase Ste14